MRRFGRGPGRRRRAVVAAVLAVFVPMLPVLPAVAEPAGVGGSQADFGLPPVSANVQTVTVSSTDGFVGPKQVQHPVSYVVMPTGGKWYFQCPTMHPAAAPTADQPGDGTGTVEANPSWVQLDMDKDRCGSDGSAAYQGVSSWTSSLYANVVVSPKDARCGSLLVSRTDAFFKNLVAPVVCRRSPQIFPTQDDLQFHDLANQLDGMLASCGAAAVNWAGYDCGPHGRNLQYWPTKDAAAAYLDCDRPPKGRIPPSWQAYSGGDSGKLRDLCGMFNLVLADTGSGEPSNTTGVFLFQGVMDASVVAPLHDAAADLLNNPPPLRGSKAGSAPGWVKAVAGGILGCTVGGVAGFVVAGPVGALAGCALGGVAGAALPLLADKFKCSDFGDFSCIGRGLTGWAAQGAAHALKYAFSAYNGGVISSDLFSLDAFRRVFAAMAVLSMSLVLLYALVALLAAMAFFRPGRMVFALQGILAWSIGLTAAVPMVSLLLKACDEAANFVCAYGGSDFKGLGDQFQARVTAILNGDAFGGVATNLLGLVLSIALIVGAGVLLFNGISRIIGIAYRTVSLPPAIAASAGPASIRKTPYHAIAALITLAVFKVLLAVMLTFIVLVPVSGDDVMHLSVLIVALLGVLFAGWKMAGLLDIGLGHAAGEEHHRRASAGAAIATSAAAGWTASRLYSSIQSGAGFGGRLATGAARQGRRLAAGGGDTAGAQGGGHRGIGSLTADVNAGIRDQLTGGPGSSGRRRAGSTTGRHSAPALSTGGTVGWVPIARPPRPPRLPAPPVPRPGNGRPERNGRNPR